MIRTDEEMKRNQILRALIRFIYSEHKTVSELDEMCNTDEQTLIDEISKVDKNFKACLEHLTERQAANTLSRALDKLN